MRIAVLAGGTSPERDVSVLSGKNVISALCQKHSVILVDPARETEIFDFSSDVKTVNNNFDRTRNKYNAEFPIISPSALKICRSADKVFILLHGGAGENGELQKVLEENSIDFSGSGSESCFLAMNKGRSKLIFKNSGIRTPDFAVFNGFSKPDVNIFPCVVKPICGGSSIGVRFFDDIYEFRGCFEFQNNNDSEEFMVEEKISGREFTVGILEDKPLAVTEILPKTGFYDYDNKYTSGKTTEITPADLSPCEYEKAMKIALDAHTALGLRNFSRTDMIKCSIDGEFYVLETNAIPGMTEYSLLPQMAKAAGLSLLRLSEKMLGI